MFLNRSAMLALVMAVPCLAPAAPSVEEFLVTGKLDEGEKALQAHLDANPDDDNARFGLGVVQFLHGVERVGQFLHRKGVNENLRQLPLLRMPVPPNDDPETTTYDDCRAMLKTLLADLTTAEATLAKIDGDVKLPIAFGQIRLDLDGNGEATDDEALWKIYAVLNRRVSSQQDFEQRAKEFRIAFDTGDVYWLRGYCHLLSAFAEIMLAHDGERWFEHCGHLLFAKTDTPISFLNQPEDHNRRGWNPNDFADVIAAFHLLDFELKEPERMASAREHLLAMTALSGQSWDAIVAETDNDAEWLPNPKQQSVVGVDVSNEMIDTWRRVMKQFASVLNGETLVPFWRDPSQGINIKRVFTEPRRIDLVLWIQGTAAIPYLEKGESVTPDDWRQIQQVFRGEFIGFAIWFN